MARGFKAPDRPDAWVSHLPDDYLLCRDLGHNWRPFTATFDRDHNAYIRTLRCPRCTSQRHQMLSMSGHPLTNSYSYGEGYLAPVGAGRMDVTARDSVHLESVLRLIEPEKSEAIPRPRAKPAARRHVPRPRTAKKSTQPETRHLRAAR